MGGGWRSRGSRHLPRTASCRPLAQVQEFLFNTASGAAFHEKTHELVSEGYASTQISRDRMLLVALATFLGMGVGLLVVSAVVMMPVLYAIDRSRDAVLENFLHVPVPVLEVLKTTVDRGLKDMQRETDGEADSDESDDDGRPATGGRGSGGGGGGSVGDFDNLLGSDGGGGGGGDGDVNWEGLFARLAAQNQAAVASASRRGMAPRPSFRSTGPSAAGAAAAVIGDGAPPHRRASGAGSPAAVVPMLGSGGGKKAAKSWRSYASLLSFLLPNVAMLLLYGIVYAVTVSSTADFVQLQRMFTIASFRGTQTPEVVMNLRRSIMFVGFQFERELHYDGAWSVLHELTASHAYLTYGTPPGQLTLLKEGYEFEPQIGALGGSESEGFPQLAGADNDRIKQLALQDACPIVVTLPLTNSLLRRPSLADCAAFQDGAVRTGLQFLMQRYLAQSAALMRVLELTSVPLTSANGTGTLRIPPTSTSLLQQSGFAATENDTVSVGWGRGSGRGRGSGKGNHTPRCDVVRAGRALLHP
jgi:hypothetical protein